MSYTKDQIIRDTQRVLNDNYISDPPVNIYEIAKNYGFVVEEQIMPPKHSNVSGFITIENGIPHLVINASDTQNRKNFTVAHELGHWRLHEKELTTDPALSVLFRIPLGTLNKDPLEKQANMFAANILVPESMLKKKCAEKLTRQELARAFGVSEEVIGYRLEQTNVSLDIPTQQ